MPSANIERYVAQQQAAEAARKAAAKARAALIAANRAAVYSGGKYKPNPRLNEMIGVQDAVLYWATETGVDNSTDDAGNSGVHKSVFDTTTYADQAQIKLLNDSGATQYIRALAIKGKPVWRASNAWEHPYFVDHDDIFYNGENVFEFGNNYIVTKDQIEQLADYYAKALGALQGNAASPKNKHIYVLSIPGRCWHYEPGEWVTVQIGGSGEKEYIDSVCEIYSVSVEAGAGDLGTTIVTLREVEQNWVKDSNAVARFLATGDPRWKPNNFGQVVVAAKNYLGTADYYCDGTADQTEIQAAVDYLSNAFGGGTVQLTEGIFYISAAIEMKSSIDLMGKGNGTIISRNCNDYAIEVVGVVGTHKSYSRLIGLWIKRAQGDFFDVSLVYCTYADNMEICSCRFENAGGVASLSLNICTDININNNFLDYFEAQAIKAEACTGIITTNLLYGLTNNPGNSGILATGTAAGQLAIINNKIHDINGDYAIKSDTNDIIISNNIIENISGYSNNARAIELGADNNIVSGNRIDNALYTGIYVSAGTKNTVSANLIKNCGNIIDRADCESATVPAIDSEVGNTLTQCTYARSDVQQYEGTYSYLLTKTVAAGTAATAYLTDSAATNDLHGLYAGQEYRFGAWVYIPAGGMTGAELTLVIRDYIAAWEEEAQACANTYDEWQYVEVTKTLRAGSTGATFGFAVASTAENAELAYTDNLRLTPMGTGNLHNQNFYDGGTGTYIGV